MASITAFARDGGGNNRGDNNGNNGGNRGNNGDNGDNNRAYGLLS